MSAILLIHTQLSKNDTAPMASSAVPIGKRCTDRDGSDLNHQGPPKSSCFFSRQTFLGKPFLVWTFHSGSPGRSITASSRQGTPSWTTTIWFAHLTGQPPTPQASLTSCGAATAKEADAQRFGQTCRQGLGGFRCFLERNGQRLEWNLTMERAVTSVDLVVFSLCCIA